MNSSERLAKATGLVELRSAITPSATCVWREAYIAVYGCEPSYPADHYQAAYDVIEQAMARRWRSLSDTAWLDGRNVVLLAYGMEVEARYCEGGWSEDTPINSAEYDGAVWSCFDDKFQIEIEEISKDPAVWCHGQATHWRELTPRPSDAPTPSTSPTPHPTNPEKEVKP